MKHWLLSLISVAVLAVAIWGAGGAAAAGFRDASGSNPQSIQIISRQVNLRSASKGRISETDSYQTTDTLAAVLARYTGHYQLEPGQHKPGQCVILTQANGYLLVHQTVLVTLCPSGNRTQVVLYRDLSWYL